MIHLLKETQHSYSDRQYAGQKVSYPGEAKAANAFTEHVCQHGRERVSSGKVGKKMWALPVGDLEIKNKEKHITLGSKVK